MLFTISSPFLYWHDWLSYSLWYNFLYMYVYALPLLDFSSPEFYTRFCLYPVHALLVVQVMLSVVMLGEKGCLFKHFNWHHFSRSCHKQGQEAGSPIYNSVLKVFTALYNHCLRFWLGLCLLFVTMEPVPELVKWSFHLYGLMDLPFGLGFLVTFFLPGSCAQVLHCMCSLISSSSLYSSQ